MLKISPVIVSYICENIDIKCSILESRKLRLEIFALGNIKNTFFIENKTFLAIHLRSLRISSIHHHLLP